MAGKDMDALKTAQLRTCGEVGRANADGLALEYWYLRGGVQTLVFLHGNSAGKEVFFRQFEAFATSGYSLLAIDLPGHGGSANSSAPERDYNFPAFALQIKRLLASLGIQSPLLIGWSLGGHIVLEMAGRGFDMAGAMIFGTPPMGPGMDDFSNAFLPSPAAAVTLNPSPSENDLAVYVGELYGSLKERPAAFSALASRMDGAVRAHMGAHWSSGDYGCHQKTVAAGWDKPLCVIHGAEDVFISGDYLESLTWRSLWRGEIIALEGVGHAPFLEAPETFNAYLADFAEHVFAQSENTP